MRYARNKLHKIFFLIWVLNDVIKNTLRGISRCAQIFLHYRDET